jgi:hypothetical protein
MPGPWQAFQQQPEQDPEQEQPYQPSMLERASEAVQGVGRTLAPAIQYAGQINKYINPLGASALDAMGAASELSNRGGEYVSEKSGEHGLPPVVGGALGFAAANLPFAVVPTPGLVAKAGGRAFAPVVPASRAPMVAAAERMGVPLTRAEMTGSRGLAAAENYLEKSPLGSGPMQEFKTGQLGKLQQAKSGLQETMGTQEDLFGVGEKIQRGQAARTTAMKTKRDELFANVPEDVNIPLNESQKMADTIIQEQSKFMGKTRNADVTGLAEDVQNAARTVTEGTPNWASIQRLREVLTERIKATNRGVQSGLPGQANAVSRDYQRLKAALDSDINNFGASGLSKQSLPIVEPGSKTGTPHALFAYSDDFGPGGTPRDIYNVFGDPTNPAIKERGWGSSVSKADLDAAGIPVTGREPRSEGFLRSNEPVQRGDFAKEYRKANAFSGAYKGLFKSDDAIAIANAPAERVVDMIFKKNNETAIKRFRAIAGNDGFEAAKQKFTQDLLESGNVEAELAKYKPGTLSAIYTKPELQQVRDYGSTQGITKTVGNLQGTSGSARTNVAVGQGIGLGGGVVASLMTGNPLPAVLGAAQLIAPRYAAKAYLSEAMTRGISTGIRPGVAKGAERAAIYGTFIDRITTKDNQR